MFVEYLMAILDFANILMSISDHMCKVIKYLMSDTFQWSKEVYFHHLYLLCELS